MTDTVPGEGHTKGPWRAEHQPFGSAIYVEGGKTIATAHGSAAITREELPHHANARLIAAAPDLLAALVAMADYYGPALINSDFPTEAANMKNALTAIAKAQGAQP